jgi:hypothetical protein
MEVQLIDITQIVNQHGNGALLAEINDTLKQLVKDCRDTGKKGVVQISLAIEPSTTRDGMTQVKISPNVTSKNPKYDAGVQYFYVVTDDQDQPVGLEKDDPRQTTMFTDLKEQMKDAG